MDRSVGDVVGVTEGDAVATGSRVSRGSTGLEVGASIADSVALGEADDDVVGRSVGDVVGVTEGDAVGTFVFLHFLLQVAGQ